MTTRSIVSRSHRNQGPASTSSPQAAARPISRYRAGVTSRRLRYRIPTIFRRRPGPRSPTRSGSPRPRGGAPAARPAPPRAPPRRGCGLDAAPRRADADRPVLYRGGIDARESPGAPAGRAGADGDQPRGRVEAAAGPRSSVGGAQHLASRGQHPDVAGQVSRALLASVHPDRLLLTRGETDAPPPHAVPHPVLSPAQ